jgi:hypothetical protein
MGINAEYVALAGMAQHEDLLGARSEWQDRCVVLPDEASAQAAPPEENPAHDPIVSPACPSETLVCRNTCGAG